MSLCCYQARMKIHREVSRVSLTIRGIIRLGQRLERARRSRGGNFPRVWRDVNVPRDTISRKWRTNESDRPSWKVAALRFDD